MTIVVTGALRVKTTELLNCVLIVVCAVIWLNIVCHIFST